LPKLRIRQHVNPLLRKFQQQIALPEWHQVYANPNLALHLDIGCARGKFLLEMAQLHPEINFLGIEVRHCLVAEANRERAELGLTNLYYLFGSINYAATEIFNSFPFKKLQYITIQFPDPWFKRKHNKRRVVQPELVDLLVDYLIDGGTIFLQSDIQEVAREMRDRFIKHPCLAIQHQEFWLAENPFLIPTERESYVLADNLPVYRVLFQKAIANF
jgi:tRNA (guanine-N7-)-methyltransferase